ncbi:unnamed protein product [Ectocarpus fasciculatus]
MSVRVRAFANMSKGRFEKVVKELERMTEMPEDGRPPSRRLVQDLLRTALAVKSRTRTVSTRNNLLRFANVVV